MLPVTLVNTFTLSVIITEQPSNDSVVLVAKSKKKNLNLFSDMLLANCFILGRSLGIFVEPCQHQHVIISCYYNYH